MENMLASYFRKLFAFPVLVKAHWAVSFVEKKYAAISNLTLTFTEALSVVRVGTHIIDEVAKSILNHFHSSIL
jgi:hypothetical protein